MLFSKVPVLLAGAAAIAFIGGSAAEEVISVRVKPNVCLAPCQPTVSVTVNAPKGSPVCLILNSLEYERKSCWLHDGYKVTAVVFRGVPAGDYQVIAAVRIYSQCNDSQRESSSPSVSVAPSDTECKPFTDSQHDANLRVVDQYGLFTEDGQP